MAKKKQIKKKGIVKNVTAFKKVPISNNINSEAIAAALSITNQPVFLKVCRLCETKDGPFLNIFDIDKIIAKKIEDVMPFAVAENDDLPHKICFRCSAKVEELHEFIQKCVKTQINLRRAIGNIAPLPNKIKHRKLWEEKLNESNISNDDICDALIKKAMESIKEPLKIKPLEERSTTSSNKAIEKDIIKEKIKEFKDGYPITNYETTDLNVEGACVDDGDVPLKKIKSHMKKSDRNKSIGRTKRDEDNFKKDNKISTKPNVMDNTNLEEKQSTSSDTLKNDLENITNHEEPSKPFNILDHVSMIKVNGVGVLFQCKLCNRNFLKKEVVTSHGCAKNGGTKKVESNKEPPKPPEPPKIATVKYINTKVPNEVKKPIIVDEPINVDDDDDEDDKPLKPQKVKPKIGPASKVKKNYVDLDPTPQPKSDLGTSVAQHQDNTNTNPMSQTPIVQFPSIPSTNSRYKLVPGPNNTFTLIEEGAENPPIQTLNPNSILKPEKQPLMSNTLEEKKDTKPTIKSKASKKANSAAPVIPQDDNVDKPYPVGLFQTVTHSPNSSNPPDPPTFTTPAMKKQSYTVVQTGNPSKLLISTKPQPTEQTVPKKRPRKTKHEPMVDEPSKEPFSVTLEDTAPPRDTGFFTFINVDPLLQPSYVLPTDSIIQESQITTSTNAVQKSVAQDKDLKYTCNMCNEKFTREKKLLTHIQSHYNKMDEEDQLRAGSNNTPLKKRARSGVKK